MDLGNAKVLEGTEAGEEETYVGTVFVKGGKKRMDIFCIWRPKICAVTVKFIVFKFSKIPVAFPIPRSPSVGTKAIMKRTLRWTG